MAITVKRNSVQSYLNDINAGKIPTSGMNGQFIQNSKQQIAFADNVDLRRYPSAQMGYADAQQQLAQQLPQRKPTNSSYIFTIQNTDVATQTVVIGAPNIFGFGAATNFGNNALVVLTGQTRPYAQFINGLSAAPVVVQGMRIISPTTPQAQFAQLQLQVTEIEVTGRRVTDQIPQALFINSMQQDPTIFDIQSLENKLDGNTYYSLQVLAGLTITVVLNFASVMDLSQTLQGDAPLTLGNAPLAANAQFAKLIA